MDSAPDISTWSCLANLKPTLHSLDPMMPADQHRHQLSELSSAPEFGIKSNPQRPGGVIQ